MQSLMQAVSELHSVMQRSDSSTHISMHFSPSSISLNFSTAQVLNCQTSTYGQFPRSNATLKVDKFPISLIFGFISSSINGLITKHMIVSHGQNLLTFKQINFNDPKIMFKKFYVVDYWIFTICSLILMNHQKTIILDHPSIGLIGLRDLTN